MNKFVRCVALSFSFMSTTFALPTGFIHLKYIDPSIVQDIRYFSKDNFMGQRVPGYEGAACILTRDAAFALARVQEELSRHDLGLKVFDCYRPQRAVDAFAAWSTDSSEQQMKAQYFPNVNKEDFFKLNYVALKSGHTRGSTVDLTVVKYKKGKPVELDMGTHWDYLDPSSHPSSEAVSENARRNRQQLARVMAEAGFAPLDTEWWHFTLVDEPNTDVYYNFPVS